MSPLQRVLYVEDDPDIRLIAQVALEMVGSLTVKVCTCGEEALSVMADFGPDLVLLDVMMPKMDGPAIFKALRARPEFIRLPVVFMTAKVQPPEVAQLMSMGALAVIAKPFDPMTLASQIRGIWETAHE